MKHYFKRGDKVYIGNDKEDPWYVIELVGDEQLRLAAQKGGPQRLWHYSHLTKYPEEIKNPCSESPVIVGRNLPTIELEEIPIVTKRTQVKSEGGPSSYYDQPYSEWKTVNDQMEWLAEHKWGKYGIHLKDIFKGLCRWNTKEGTTALYDTKKVIYYGLRILRMLEGNSGVQAYLKELSEDKQFND